MVFRHQVFRRGRIGRAAPFRVVYLVFWTQIRGGITVTVQTELHRETPRFVAEGHPIYLAMTTRAADAFGDVNAVVEIDIVWQIIDPVPDNRLVIDQAMSQGGQKPSVRPNLGVAGHAGVCWRHPRIG